jgi:hypothetical protein
VLSNFAFDFHLRRHTEVAQDALSSPDLRVETHHLLSFILALCGTARPRRAHCTALLNTSFIT